VLSVPEPRSNQPDSSQTDGPIGAFHAHLVQVDIAWEDPGANHEAVRRMLDRVDVAPGDLILLPEMFATGFSFNVEKTNDKAGATLAFLEELANDFRAVVQGGRTVAACHACSASNVMTVMAPGSRLLAEYRKIHPFMKEAERFEGGRDVVTFPWAGLTICPAICYDLRFPELFRLGMKKGAEAYSVGACWPSVRHIHWRTLLIARAIENQAFVLGCNRTGADPARDNAPPLQYAGGSIAIGPKGEVLGELDEKPGVLSVKIDAAEVRNWRGTFPALRDVKLI
jgi:omega-amidase